MKNLLSLILLIFFTISVNSQSNNNKLSSDVIKIPFELSNNLIILDVVFNGISLKMIADSGSDQSLLFSLPSKDSLFIDDAEVVQIKGVGKDSLIDAYLSQDNTLKIGKYIDKNFDILIIPNHEINIANVTGIQINGILGSSFFAKNLIEIKYDKEKIFIYQNRKVIPNKLRKYQSVTLNVFKSKPYFTIPVTLDDKNQNLKLLLDTGLSDGLWLFENDSIQSSSIFFDDILGYGLTGIIHGKRSRVKNISLSSYKLENVLVSYPIYDNFKGISILKGRNGSLGGQILKRFNVFFDYYNKKFYFKKNQNFDAPFEYNMAGLEVQHKGSEWSKYEVSALDRKSNVVDKETNFYKKEIAYKYELIPIYEVLEVRVNSPAYFSGLQKGDIILKINGKKTSNLKLDYFNEIFSSTAGKNISLEIKRNDKVLKFKFQLEKVL
ncbi:MAG: aspartyl protease family protein [Flavobacterium sp.]|jgi:hypothetical protein|nr:aspartyl protease family protein [Flavobacterium sp.]